MIPIRSQRSFGTPHVTDDGTTIVPVLRRRDDAEQAMGVFAIKDGTAQWVPVVDADRIALIGVVTGLIAATLGCLAVVKQPPWPKFSITRS